MSKTINKGFTDKVAITKSINIPDLSWDVDFKTKVDEPDEVILTNVTSPLDRPELFRFGYTEIKDVYKNTTIDPSVYAPTRRGIQILCQVNDVYSLTDDVDASYRVDLPVQAHVVLKVPACDVITADMVEELAQRAVSGLFATGSVTSAKLSAMLRGSMRP